MRDVVSADLAAEIARVVAADDLGQPVARKRGRSAQYPYVPLIIRPGGKRDGGTYEQQIRGLSYATADEARAVAERLINAERDDLRRKLAMPNMRVLRQQYGLPRDIDGAQ